MSTSKTLIRLRSASISVVVPLICIRMNSIECLPNGLGTRENDIALPSPTPPQTMVLRTGKGKGTFCSISGSSQQWNWYFLWGHYE